jgi:phage terminase small subunit
VVNKRHKPQETLQDRRTSRTRSAPAVPDHVEDPGLPALPQDIPPCPAGLRPATKANWATFWMSPLRPFLVGVDRLLIDRYFQVMDERDVAWVNYRRKKQGIGSTGQTQVSHWWGIVRDCEKILAQMEAQLGIGPLSRMRLNISFAQAAESLADMLAAMNKGAVGAGEEIELD